MTATPTKYAIHPVASLFPPMDADQFAALKHDIGMYGQREPITLHQGAVIDGLHRLRACDELGREPLTREWDGIGDLTAYVVSLNLKRRQLTESQRAMVGEKVANLSDGQKKANAGPDGLATVSREDAAALLNVGTTSITRARQVRRQGSPELIRAVESGEVRLGTAARAAQFPKEEQMAVARAPKAQPKSDPAKPRRGNDGLPQLERAARAIDTMETMASILESALSSLGKDRREDQWAEQLRQIRESVSRFIRKCEGK